MLFERVREGERETGEKKRKRRGPRKKKGKKNSKKKNPLTQIAACSAAATLSLNEHHSSILVDGRVPGERGYPVW